MGALCSKPQPDRAPDSRPPNEIKVVIVGDPAVGKTCLIHFYENNEYFDTGRPTVHEVYRVDREVNVGT